VLQDEMQGEVERERRQWRKAQATRDAARAAKHTRSMRAVVHDLTTFALRVAEYRARTGCNVPRKEYNGWLAAFIAGETGAGDAGQDNGDTADGDDAVDTAALDDYLHARGEWAQQGASGEDGETTPQFNSALAEAVHAVRAAAVPPPAAQPIALTMPIRLAVIGAPFTGKSTLAAKLAEAHRAVVLDPEALVAAAVKEADGYTEPEPQVGTLHMILCCSPLL
jgi:hypothetical protein